MARRKTKEVWLNPCIFEWEAMVGSSIPNFAREWRRAHEIWSHAEKRLLSALTDEDRADVVSILRRVLNHRISRLRKLYLDKLPLLRMPSRAIEQLELVGVAKRGMVHKLLEIRNRIEYRDRKPPSTSACSELLEFVWYFLRSTDPLVSQVVKDFEVYKHSPRGNRTAYWFMLYFGPKTKWKAKIHGWVEPADISFTPVHGWLKVQAEMVKQLKDSEKLGLAQNVLDKELDKSEDEKLKDEDFYIAGKFDDEPSQLKFLCRFYFSNPNF